MSDYDEWDTVDVDVPGQLADAADYVGSAIGYLERASACLREIEDVPDDSPLPDLTGAMQGAQRGAARLSLLLSERLLRLYDDVDDDRLAGPCEGHADCG